MKETNSEKKELKSDQKESNFIDYEKETTTTPQSQVSIVPFIINLDRRPDRLQKFEQMNKPELTFNCQRFPAIDGQKLTPNTRILKLFETGDYKYRKNILGCALSHLQLWFIMLNVPDNVIFLILEDDVQLNKNFYHKLNYLMNTYLKNNDWEVVFLGHHLYPKYREEKEYNLDAVPTVRKWYKSEAVMKSMGGTGGYLINKKGAQHLLELIRQQGMPFAVDWVMFKNAKEDENDVSGLNIYYSSPHLIFSACFDGNNKVDSDIQFDFSNLYQDINTRLINNINFLLKELKQDGIQLMNYKPQIEVKTIENSKLVITQYLPNKQIFLTKVVIIDYTKYKDESIISLRNKVESYPIYWYTIEDKQKYMILFPEPLLSENIEKEFVFGGYLDKNTLKNINNN